MDARLRAATTIAMVACLTACGIDVTGAESLDASAPMFDATNGHDAPSPTDARFEATTPLPDAAPSDDANAAADVAIDGGSGIDSGDDDAGDAEPDAPFCFGGVICNGVCLVGQDCSNCSAGNLLCFTTGTCGDCSSCPDGPIQCFECDVLGNNPYGSCGPNDPTRYCLNGANDPTRVHCPCADGDAGACPGAMQVCTPGAFGSYCATCGEMGTENGDCNDGKKCHVTGGATPNCH
jgi:hypothetical protein